jgi:hypothetical protein
MDTQGLHDLTEDSDPLSVYRDRAKAMLDQVVRLTKQMLAEHMISLDIFFLIPNSGNPSSYMAPLPIPMTLYGNELATSSRQSCGRWLDWMARGADQLCVVQPPTPWPITSARRCRYPHQWLRQREPTNEVR